MFGDFFEGFLEVFLNKNHGNYESLYIQIYDVNCVEL